MTNLKAENQQQELILAYINENASDILTHKINTGSKTMAQCWDYIVGEAKKKSKNRCAMVEDREVFGWAMHFFEEDSIKPNKANTETKKTEHKKPEPKPEPKKEEKKTKSTEVEGQMSLMDFFGGM